MEKFQLTVMLGVKFRNYWPSYLLWTQRYLISHKLNIYFYFLQQFKNRFQDLYMVDKLAELTHTQLDIADRLIAHLQWANVESTLNLLSHSGPNQLKHDVRQNILGARRNFIKQIQMGNEPKNTLMTHGTLKIVPQQQVGLPSLVD